MNATAASRNMRFGSCYAWSRPGADAGSFANPDYAALLERDCGILVPENELKWQYLEPARGKVGFGRFDAMLAYAQKHGFAVRGHNLLWHQPRWMPRWTEHHDYGADPATAGRRILTDHVTQVVARYRDRIHSWDVVNEAVSHKDGSYYTTALSRAIDPDPLVTLDLAFRTARKAAPDAQLVYNDYMSWEPGNADHRAGVLRLLRAFRARGTPVDALGVQSHIGVLEKGNIGDLVARYTPDWRAFLDAVVDLGYDLVVTELDVRDDKLATDKAVRDRQIADYARGYLDVMLAYPQLRDVLVWGMSDRYNWLREQHPRADGTAKRPCPYDADFRAKPLRAAIEAAFAAAQPRG